MHAIHFKGFFQCRLATDPDNTEDPRGQNGWTFAFDGERFQNPVSPRSCAPPTSVMVVDVDGNAGHALAGAQVELLENAKFEAVTSRKPHVAWDADALLGFVDGTVSVATSL